jgi:hypothetical protein
VSKSIKTVSNNKVSDFQDKNGVLIQEGDIVYATSTIIFFREYQGRYFVYSQNGLFGMKAANGMGFGLCNEFTYEIISNINNIKKRKR